MQIDFHEDFPTMPTDCLVGWVGELRCARGGLGDGREVALLDGLEAEARRRWLRHQLTPNDLRTYFSEASHACERMGQLSLRASAEHRLATLQRVNAGLDGSLADRREIFSSLNENLAGRLFDSILAREIALHPTRRMKDHFRAFGLALESVFETFPDSEKARTLRLIKEIFSQHWTFRGTADPMALAFADPRRDDLATIAEDFRRCLRSGMEDCPSHGFLPHLYLVTQFCHLMEDEYPELVPWRNDSLAYFQVMRAVRSRDAEVHEKHVTHRTGILFEQQIGLEEEEVQNVRAIDFLGGLDIEHLKPPAECALLHGLPFVCGISAHTMNLVHAMAYFRNERKMESFEPRYVFLAYIALLVHIGAHSIQEAAWTAHALDGPLLLGLSDFWTEKQYVETLDRGAAEHYHLLTRSQEDTVAARARQYLIEHALKSNFVVDYERLFSAFAADEETHTVLERALRRAWEAVIEEGERRGIRS